MSKHMSRHPSLPKIDGIMRSHAEWVVDYEDETSERFSVGSQRYYEFAATLYDATVHNVTATGEYDQLGVVTLSFDADDPVTAIKNLRASEPEWRPVTVLIKYSARV